MKALLLISAILVSATLSGQVLELNENNNFYEFSKVQEYSDSLIHQNFDSRLKALNYKEITIKENFIEADGFTNHLVGGFATVEINYKIKLQFKEGRYKLTLTNFIVTDKNGSNPLEGMKGFIKKWVKIINKKLPEIVDSVEKLEPTNEW